MNSLHESPGVRLRWMTLILFVLQPVLSEEFWCQFDESLQETLALVEGGTVCVFIQEI